MYTCNPNNLQFYGLYLLIKGYLLLDCRLLEPQVGFVVCSFLKVRALDATAMCWVISPFQSVAVPKGAFFMGLS